MNNTVELLERLKTLQSNLTCELEQIQWSDGSPEGEIAYAEHDGASGMLNRIIRAMEAGDLSILDQSHFECAENALGDPEGWNRHDLPEGETEVCGGLLKVYTDTMVCENCGQLPDHLVDVLFECFPTDFDSAAEVPTLEAYLADCAANGYPRIHTPNYRQLHPEIFAVA